MSEKEFRVLSPTGILGYGFPESSFLRGLEMQPHLIAVDAGSVDPGPYYLGAGKSFTNRAAVKRDLRYILTAATRLRIPAIIGSAGGCGAAPHVEWCREIIEEIAAEAALSFKMGVIFADIAADDLIDAVKAGKTSALAGLPELTPETVRKARRIVAQMGMGPIQDALGRGCQVVLAGRAYDPSVFAALPTTLGYDPGLALHMGKILECAAIAATPGSGADAVLGILRDECFELTALNPARKFTADSAAAHSLYEKSDPYLLPGPGGALDLTDVRFESLPEGRVRISGSRFRPSPTNTVKVEGVEQAGFRTVSIAGIRDPIMIRQIDEIIARITGHIAQVIEAEELNGLLHFHVYGKNGVMGRMEPLETAGHELCVVLEAVGASQNEADTICSLARSNMLHYGYENRIATAGNLAFPFSPSDFSIGEAYVFSIYHLLEIEDDRMFKIEIDEL